VGFSFGNGMLNVTEADLQQKAQVLDLWSGEVASFFVYNGSTVEVETYADPASDTVAISIQSELLKKGGLGLFFDFPYPDLNKFNAPFVGVLNATTSHSTNLTMTSDNSATIHHVLDGNSYYMTATWEGKGTTISGPASGTHRYSLASGTNTLHLTLSFAPTPPSNIPTQSEVSGASKSWWRTYWCSGAFVDLSAAKNQNPANVTELQRRILLSQYLSVVNSASSYPPQESGLVNNGWYGKFHLEMYLWHSLHFARWNNFPLLWRSLPNTFTRFLDSSRERAQKQGYTGARWSKMTDPSGRSAPGEINSLLIWQQPHPMFFAETEYRSFPNATTLERWDDIITATADFMASFAFFNASTGVFDLGPPMYPVGENTPPNSTRNAAFELAYWRFGLDVAVKWCVRQNRTVPTAWTDVRDGLAPLPVVDDTYASYEGVQGMWTDAATTTDHPAMAGIYGLLPPPISGPSLNETILRNTAAKIASTWALDESYGWDFSMLAMNSLRLGDSDQAVAYLLHPIFQFDDAGYPVGGSRVPTPYFPNAASLLLAVAMMAGGWDGQPGPHFPQGWDVDVDGFVPGL
jgi:hypothetical protein